MSETVEIFGKAYKSYEMTHADKVTAWIQSAPEVDIHVGKFTLKYRYGYDRDWGSAWVCWSNPDWEDTPEEQYFEEVCDAMRTWHSEISFIDNLIDAMKKKPFPMDWSKTHAEWDGEDWLFYNVPPEAGWASGQTCFSERELGMCISPERAIKALKAWVAESKGGL